MKKYPTAGRPKNDYKTTTMRIPLPLKERILEMVRVFKKTV